MMTIRSLDHDVGQHLALPRDTETAKRESEQSVP